MLRNIQNGSLISGYILSNQRLHSHVPPLFFFINTLLYEEKHTASHIHNSDMNVQTHLCIVAHKLDFTPHKFYVLNNPSNVQNRKEEN